MVLLKVRDLKKSYKRGILGRNTEILKGINFDVPAGAITGFLGANGAGKTTTMRCMLGLDFADSGVVEFFGEPLGSKTKARIGFLPERPYFYEYLTGFEFLEFYGQLSGLKSKEIRERAEVLLKRVDLEFAKNRYLRNYSKGMLQKIGIAQALIHNPELVILDEPMSGLDPDGRMALAEIILETARNGTAVFFTSHLLNDTEKLCERLIMIKDGKTLYEGGTNELLDAGSLETEITYIKSGERKNIKVPANGNLQAQLDQLSRDGSTIYEVRRNRPSLEEVFVRMALRGGGRK